MLLTAECVCGCRPGYTVSMDDCSTRKGAVSAWIAMRMWPENVRTYRKCRLPEFCVTPWRPRRHFR
jgi:hypothetical protein